LQALRHEFRNVQRRGVYVTIVSSIHAGGMIADQLRQSDLAVDDYRFLCNSSALGRIGGRKFIRLFAKILIFIATYINE
jgi:hypothetical protein